MAAKKIETELMGGKDLAAQIRKEIYKKVATRREAGLPIPGLATILVGDDPASKIYVGSKQRSSEKVGIESHGYEFPENVRKEKVFGLISSLNENPGIHGILLQLPLPPHLEEAELIQRISPEKDVDGLHPLNAGLLAQKGRTPLLAPATPSGIMKLLQSKQIEIEGSHAVVVGRSNIVGVPIAAMLLKANATVTICHSRTRDLAEICRQADILIAAVGIPEFVKGSWVKEGAVVIDVGVNRVDDPSKKRGYRLVGDAAFDEILGKARAITPVPGGVGPLTIAMVLENTLRAAELAD